MAFWSGYVGVHGLEVQIVYLHIGLTGPVFITDLQKMIMVSKIWANSMITFWDYFKGYLFVASFLIFNLMRFLLSWLKNAAYLKLIAIVAFFNMRLASLREYTECVMSNHWMPLSLLSGQDIDTLVICLQHLKIFYHWMMN